MPSYIQIGHDPTKWWYDQPVDASQLAGQPLSIQVFAPVAGTMVLSPRFHTAVTFDQASEAPPPNPVVPVTIIYVPTTAGVPEGHAGHELPDSADLDRLASDITALMRDGHSQTIDLSDNASHRTLVLDGATLAFAVLCQQAPPPVVGGESAPSDEPTA
jgi:hypothetical protein